MKKWKDNISFVLVEPREPGNIGASARAIKNMGFRNLVLVNPPELKDEAIWMAHNAEDVVDSARKCSTLGDALRDRTIIVGTTRRKGRNRGTISSVEEVAEKIRDLAQCNKVAILFGREDKGLYNEELEECSLRLYIPTSKEQPSLNLAQAVLLVAYELARKEPLKAITAESTVLLSHGELACLFEHIEKTLALLDYVPKGDRDLTAAIMLSLKRFIARAGINEWEYNMLHGICSSIERKLKKP